MVSEGTKEPAQKAANPGEVTEREKSLQRQLEKQRGQNRMLMSQLLETRSTSQSIEQIADLIQADLKKRADEGDEDAEKALASYGTKVEQGKAYQLAAKTIADAFIEHDTDWSDERLSEAHVAWDSGNVKRAAELVVQVLGGADQTQNFNAAVEAAVAKALGKTGKVTTKEGSAPVSGPGVRVADLASIGRTRKAPAALAAEHSSLLDAFYKE